MERKVILVRHLQTVFNRDGMIMGGTVDLNVIDNKEAIENMTSKINGLLEDFKLNSSEIVIISSPLIRCLETSEKIKQSISPEIKVLVDVNLAETDMGDFAGKKASQLREEYGDLIDEWMYEPETFKFPNGESYEEVKQRVVSIMNNIKNNYKDKKVIILCTHVDIIKMFVCIINGVSFNSRRDFEIPNASVSLVTLDKNGNQKVEKLNI